jgi:hypothetical protein
MGPAVIAPIFFTVYGGGLATAAAFITENESSKSAPSHRGKTLVRYDYGSPV